MKHLVATALIALSMSPLLSAQTIDDGIMMSQGSLQVGVIYARDRWDEYWEGSLKRVNGNIGTITTETGTSHVAYGVTNRLMLVGSLPYVWTNPSQGVLQGQSGVQDLHLGGKVGLVEIAPRRGGVIRAIAALSGRMPLADYNPDFAPLSIGSQSRSLSGRLTLNLQTSPGFYVNGTGAYTRRSHVTLDRPYYYTDGHLFFTDTVDMPAVVDATFSAGYLKHDVNLNVSYTRQTTQGGGDIRRQDMPFVSNRVNFDRAGVMAMFAVPRARAVSVYVSAGHVLDGRNTGQSTSVALGLLYSRAAHGRLIR